METGINGLINSSLHRLENTQRIESFAEVAA